MNRNGARYILEYMKEMGVNYIFGIPGNGNAPLYDELYDFTDINPIVVNHEQAAAFMADGYYRITHRIAACTGTGGPGAVNLISGLDESFQDSIPVLAITTNVPAVELRKDKDFSTWRFGLTSHVSFAKPITKWTTLVTQASQIPRVVKRAFKVMREWPKGPVLIDLCYDTMKDSVMNKIDRVKDFEEKSVEPPLDELKKVAKKLISSNHVTILAGEGIHDSNSYEELLELASVLSAPVATTMAGKSSFPEDHPLALGVEAIYSGSKTNRYLKKNKTEILLVLGCNSYYYFPGDTLGWAIDFDGDEIIQVDRSTNKMSVNCKRQINIVGDLNPTLKKLLSLVKALLNRESKENLRAKNSRDDERIREILALKKELSYYSETEMFSDVLPIKPQRACREIRDFAEKDAIFWADCGNNLFWASGCIQTSAPRTFLVGSGLTHMGFSLAASIGTKLAVPERQVIDIIGNASFQMMCQEVFTATKHNIPVIWCILNDGNLGRMKQGQKFGYRIWKPERYIATSSYAIDVEKFAQACKAFGRTVVRASEIRDALEEAINSARPSIIDIKIDPDEIPSPVIMQNRRIIDANPSLLSKKMPVPSWPRHHETPL